MEKSEARKIRVVYRFFLIVSAVCLVLAVILVSTGNIAGTGIPVVTMLAAMALYSRSTERFKGSSFTFWIFAFLSAALYFPVLFTCWFGFNTIGLAVPLIQIIMFGMGTKLSVDDFVREFKNVKAIFIGTVMVYTVMPLAGLFIARVFGFEPEVAAGVILIGSCP